VRPCAWTGGAVWLTGNHLSALVKGDAEGCAKNKERRTTAAPETPAKGYVKQHMADAPITGARSKCCLHVFQSRKAQVGGFSGSSDLTLARLLDVSTSRGGCPGEAPFAVVSAASRCGDGRDAIRGARGVQPESGQWGLLSNRSAATRHRGARGGA
jgi:hypothetical protein